MLQLSWLNTIDHTHDVRSSDDGPERSAKAHLRPTDGREVIRIPPINGRDGTKRESERERERRGGEERRGEDWPILLGHQEQW